MIHFTRKMNSNSNSILNLRPNWMNVLSAQKIAIIYIQHLKIIMIIVTKQINVKIKIWKNHTQTQVRDKNKLWQKQKQKYYIYWCGKIANQQLNQNDQINSFIKLIYSKRKMILNKLTMPSLQKKKKHKYTHTAARISIKHSF